MNYSKYGPWAFIAGGSEGIGESFARRLSKAGINLVLSARRREPLEVLADDIRAKSGVEVRTAAIDLCGDDVQQAASEIARGLEVGLLIYNAGSGNPSDNTDPARSIGDFHDRPVSDALSTIALNVTGMTQLTHHFGAPMRDRRRGGILLVGSTACHAGTARTAAYSASKSFQYAFAQALWCEMRRYDVDVLGLIVGAVRTPNVERTGMDMESYHGASEPDDVAMQGLANLANGPVFHVSGTEEISRNLRSLGPAEAAIAAARGIDSYFPRA